MESFTLIPLPKEAQFSMINGMVTEDFDGDGNLDLLVNGNDYGTDVSVGRYDALNGLLMNGDGQNGFQSRSILAKRHFYSGQWQGTGKIKRSQQSVPGSGKSEPRPVKSIPS